jgi:signal transduction histidine kinase
MQKEAPMSKANPAVAKPRFGLSARLLVLTILFVMIAEILIFAPSIARFRKTYLEERLGEAHLALMALEASPDGMLDMGLQKRLLQHADAKGMTAYIREGVVLMLGQETQPAVNANYRLDDADWVTLIFDAFAALFQPASHTIAVIGQSPKDPSVRIHLVVEDAAMLRAMRTYSGNIVLLSLLISVFTATLLYVVLSRLFVRPTVALAKSMVVFRQNPADASRIMEATQRSDEIGIAQNALADMQHELWVALNQQARMAAVGAGVAKITHDLKGILTTALLESDRLEMLAADSDLKKTTAGIAGALERAVSFCSTTLKHASDKPAPPQLRPHNLQALVSSSLEHLKIGADVVVCDDDISPHVHVLVDPGFFQRAFENLVRNAIEAHASQLHFMAQVLPSSQDVMLCVQDDGPGLPAKAQDHLFEPFSGSARMGGTGLGLPIAKEVMTAQGGDVQLLKTSQEGTIFLLRMKGARGVLESQ